MTSINELSMHLLHNKYYGIFTYQKLLTNTSMDKLPWRKAKKIKAKEKQTKKKKTL